MGITADQLIPRTLGIRQDYYVITQTLTWGDTVFTTHVTLGSAPTDPPTQASHHDNSSSLTNAQIGAIAGSITGVFLLVVMLFCCCRRPIPPPKRSSNRSSYSSSYIVDDSPEPWPQQPFHRPAPVYQNSATYRSPSVVPRTPVQRPPPVPELIPGGPKYPTYRANPIPNPRNPTVPHVT
ncbi:hypothetical protein G7046_g3716 [Stylonectria norvegica]|nr:hypothetical protein G7046_g3716 [Stylonectria norvegica]